MNDARNKGRDRASESTRVDWLLRRFCGASQAAIDRATAAQLRSHLDMLDRRLVRERNKGAARHWSYDLNRHIALKQTRDIIVGALRRREQASDSEVRRRPSGREQRRAAEKAEEIGTRTSS